MQAYDDCIFKVFVSLQFSIKKSLVLLIYLYFLLPPSFLFSLSPYVLSLYRLCLSSYILVSNLYFLFSCFPIANYLPIHPLNFKMLLPALILVFELMFLSDFVPLPRSLS